MKKKKYISPCLSAYHIQPAHIICASPADEINMIFSGETPVTAGPVEIDPYSTFDSF